MRTWVRRTGIGVGALLAVVVLGFGAVYAVSEVRLNDEQDAVAHEFDAAIGDVANGQHLVTSYGCTDCHGTDLGGTLLIDGMPFARIAAPNLTSGREGGPITDAQWELAVRHGIGTDGRGLAVMPSAEYVYLSDRDLADVLAYLRTVPPVTDSLPERAFGPVGRTLIAVGQLQFANELIRPDARHLPAPEKAPTREFGYYLTRLCTGCHGPQLTGGQPVQPGAPPAPDITPSGNPGNWSFEQFERTLRTGQTPEGRALNPQYMPWTAISRMTDTEVRAVWEYLSSLPPRSANEQAQAGP